MDGLKVRRLTQFRRTPAMKSGFAAQGCAVRQLSVVAARWPHAQQGDGLRALRAGRAVPTYRRSYSYIHTHAQPLARREPEALDGAGGQRQIEPAARGRRILRDFSRASASVTTSSSAASRSSRTSGHAPAKRSACGRLARAAVLTACSCRRSVSPRMRMKRHGRMKPMPGVVRLPSSRRSISVRFARLAKWRIPRRCGWRWVDRLTPARPRMHMVSCSLDAASWWNATSKVGLNSVISVTVSASSMILAGSAAGDNDV